jgi:hypothetical protein
MVRLATFIVLGLVGLVALVGCKAEGEIGDTSSNISVAR